MSAASEIRDIAKNAGWVDSKEITEASRKIVQSAEKDGKVTGDEYFEASIFAQTHVLACRDDLNMTQLIDCRQANASLGAMLQALDRSAK